jgi:galactonate dehydratase
VQEYFGDFDVPWRAAYVCGWNPVERGDFLLPDRPGLGIELDEGVCAQHPYQKNPFPSLWDLRWVRELTKSR